MRAQIATGKAAGALAIGVSSHTIGVIGAVGITGDTSDNDELCALAESSLPAWRR